MSETIVDLWNKDTHKILLNIEKYDKVLKNMIKYWYKLCFSVLVYVSKL